MISLLPDPHPLAVHFPIALSAVALVFLLGARLFAPRRWALQWAVVGHWALWLAAPTAVVAALFGWLAFNSVAHDSTGHLAMLAHRAWALPSVVALLMLAVWDVWRQQAERINPWWFLVLLAGTVAAIATTAWHGAELVYRYGLGVAQPAQVQAVPAAERPAVLPSATAAPAPAVKHGHAHRDGSVHEH